MPGVREIDKCLVRKMGLEFYVDLHVGVDEDISVRDGHSIAHMVKDAIRQTDSRIADVLVHVEPAGPSPSKGNDQFVKRRGQRSCEWRRSAARSESAQRAWEGRRKRYVASPRAYRSFARSRSNSTAGGAGNGAAAVSLIARSESIGISAGGAGARDPLRLHINSGGTMFLGQLQTIARALDDAIGADQSADPGGEEFLGVCHELRVGKILGQEKISHA